MSGRLCRLHVERWRWDNKSNVTCFCINDLWHDARDRKTCFAQIHSLRILITSSIVLNCMNFSFSISATVLRTCSELRVDDCKTVNKVHYCYCHRQLCNGENAESIIEKLGDVNDEEDEEENENFDSEEASGSDDEDFTHSSTSRNLDSTEKSTSLGGTTTRDDKLLILSVATTTLPPISEAVTSHLTKKHLIVLTLSSLIVRAIAINWTMHWCPISRVILLRYRINDSTRKTLSKKVFLNI